MHAFVCGGGNKDMFLFSYKTENAVIADKLRILIGVLYLHNMTSATQHKFQVLIVGQCPDINFWDSV